MNQNPGSVKGRVTVSPNAEGVSELSTDKRTISTRLYDGVSVPRLSPSIAPGRRKSTTFAGSSPDPMPSARHPVKRNLMVSRICMVDLDTHAVRRHWAPVPCVNQSSGLNAVIQREGEGERTE